MTFIVYLIIGLIIGFFCAKKAIKAKPEFCAKDSYIEMGLAVWIVCILLWPVALMYLILLY